MDSYHVFHLVSQTLSFSKTATILKVAPSTVSRTIDQFEQKLGFKLFTRNTKKLTLTPQGAYLADTLAPLLNTLESTINHLQNPEYQLRHPLKVNSFASFGQRFVLPSILHLAKHHPTLQFELSLDNTLQMTSQAQADIYIRIGKAKDSAFIYHKLHTSELRLYAHRNTQHHLEKITDLEFHNCLSLNSHCQPVAVNITHQGYSHKLQITGAITSEGGLVLREALYQDLGFAILPSWLIHKDDPIREPFPDAICQFDPITPSDIYAIYPKALQQDPRLIIFFQCLKDKLHLPSPRASM